MEYLKFIESVWIAAAKEVWMGERRKAHSFHFGLWLIVF